MFEGCPKPVRQNLGTDVQGDQAYQSAFRIDVPVKTRLILLIDRFPPGLDRNSSDRKGELATGFEGLFHSFEIPKLIGNDKVKFNFVPANFLLGRLQGG